MKTYKKCTITGCNGQVFAHNVCKYHYRQRPKEDKIPRIPKEIGIHKGLSGTITTSSPFNSQVSMFKYIWNTTKHKSYLSNHYLNYNEGDEFWYNLFAHVLSKKQFPLFKLNQENVILLTPYEHTLLDHGTKAQRDKYSSNWWAVKEKATALWKQYKDIDPDCSPLPKLYQYMT